MFLVKPERVDIRLVPLDQPRGLVLSDDERARAARFHFEHDRERWSRARSALRCVLAQYINAPALELEFEPGDHGKPSLVGHPIEFNLSHSGEWGLIAVSAHAPVGIDIERVRDRVDIAKLLRRIGEDPPVASVEEMFQLWTRREARTKATGAPLMQMPAKNVYASDLEAPAAYAASVAMVDAIPEPHYCGAV